MGCWAGGGSDLTSLVADGGRIMVIYGGGWWCRLKEIEGGLIRRESQREREEKCIPMDVVALELMKAEEHRWKISSGSGWPTSTCAS
ncbi:unnamed protein product [Prunus armeniaca]